MTRQGFFDVWHNRNLIAGFLPIPFLVGFLTVMAVEYFSLLDNPLLVAALKVPDEFVRGIVLVLFARFLVLNQPPQLIVNNKPALSDVVAGALTYTALNFILSGLMAGITTIMYGQTEANTDPASMVLSMIGIAVMMWMFRYQWLPIAAGTGADLREFARELGTDFGLSFRIFLLWMLIAMPALFVIALATEFIFALSGAESLKDIDGAALWLILAINVLAGLVTVFWQFAASVRAIRFCTQGPQL